MDKDLVVGTLVLIGALSIVVGLVLWSRYVIERIARRGLRTARDIMKDLRHGR